MNSMTSVGLAPATLARLIRHCEERQQNANLAEVLTDIVETWLADRGRAAAFADRHGTQEELPRGYHWKELFLPHGTRLKLYLNGPADHAEVIGDRLMFEGMVVSPNQFVSRFRHVPCNAWENLTVLFPGEKKWIRAQHLRRSQAGPRDRRAGSKPAKKAGNL